MNENYIKKEVEPNRIYYVFDNAIDNDEILSFYESIEQDNRIKESHYIVKTLADEYETGIYSFKNVESIDRELLGYLSTLSILMTVCIDTGRRNYIAHNINSNAFSLTCVENPELAGIVESHISRQMTKLKS